MLFLIGSLCLIPALMLRAVSPKKAAPPLSWDQQIASYISYPEVLQQANGEGVVVINFTVGADHRLTGLQVYSGGNEQLNNSLINQLNGKKVYGKGPKPSGIQQTYSARLHFRLADPGDQY